MAAKHKKRVTLTPCVPNEAWITALSPRAQRFLGWFLVTAFCASFVVVPTVAALVPVLAWYGRYYTAAALALVLVTASVWPTREWPAARRIWQLLYKIFRVRHNVEDDPRVYDFVKAHFDPPEGKPSQQYILGMHPHGIVPIQALIWCAYCDQYLRTREHGTVYGFGGMASVITRFPFVRTLLGWFNAQNASYRNLKRGLLTTGKNLYMLPGGLAEIFTARPGRNAAVFKRRRGLVRLSLETGAALCPLYVFGGNDFFNQLATNGSRLARLSRAMGASLTFFWGWCGLPVPLVPPRGVTICLGEPVPVERWRGPGKPPPELVEELHARYIAALQKVFDDHKAAAGEPDAVLEIL